MSGTLGARWRRLVRHVLAFPGEGYGLYRRQNPANIADLDFLHKPLPDRSRWAEPAWSAQLLDRPPFPGHILWRSLERFFLLLDLFFIPDILIWAIGLLKFNTRRLTIAEQGLAAYIFGPGFRTDTIRLDERAFVGPYSFGMAYVSFYVVNSWGKLTARTFVHELVHIWQYRTVGSAYIPRALYAQRTRMGYDYGGIAGLRHALINGKDLLDFNYEQQAEIIEDGFCLLTGKNPAYCRPTPAFYPYFAPFMEQVAAPDALDDLSIKHSKLRTKI